MIPVSGGRPLRSAKMIRLIVGVTLLLMGRALWADVISDLPREVVERSLKNMLTKEDVPLEWRQHLIIKDDTRRSKRIFFRGDTKVLEVEWSLDSKEGDFFAKVFDGENIIVRFHCFQGSTAVADRSDDRGYKLLVVVSDEGEISFGVKHKNGFNESIVVAGRETSLEDDLNYMRGRIAAAEFLPLIDQALEEVKNEKKPKKAEQSVPPKSDRAGG